MIRRLIAALAFIVPAAHATVTLTVSPTGATTPTGAYVRMDIANCTNPTVVNSGTTIPTSRNFKLNGQASVAITVEDNVTQIACNGNQLSYYTVTYVANGTQTLLKSVELPAGQFNLANLANLTTPPWNPGIIQGPAGPASQVPGPAGPGGTTTATGANGAFTIPGVATVGSIAYGPRTDQNLVIAGDSISAGAFLGPTENWPYKLSQLPFFKNRANLYNGAVSGDTCSQMTSRYTANIYPYRPQGAIASSYLTVMIGINSLSQGVSAATLESCITSYVSNAKSDGFTVTLMTILPTSLTPAPAPGFTPQTGQPWAGQSFTIEAARQQVNDWIRTGGTTADNIFDASSLLTDTWNVAWLQDGLHPSNAFSTIIARNLNLFFANGGPLTNAQDGQTPKILGDLLVSNGSNQGRIIAAGNIGAHTAAEYSATAPLIGTSLSFGGANCGLGSAYTIFSCLIATGPTSGSNRLAAMDMFGIETPPSGPAVPIQWGRLSSQGWDSFRGFMKGGVPGLTLDLTVTTPSGTNTLRICGGIIISNATACPANP